MTRRKDIFQYRFLRREDPQGPHDQGQIRPWKRRPDGCQVARDFDTGCDGTQIPAEDGLSRNRLSGEDREPCQQRTIDTHLDRDVGSDWRLVDRREDVADARRVRYPRKRNRALLNRERPGDLQGRLAARECPQGSFDELQKSVTPTRESHHTPRTPM